MGSPTPAAPTPVGAASAPAGSPGSGAVSAADARRISVLTPAGVKAPNEGGPRQTLFARVTFTPP